MKVILYLISYIYIKKRKDKFQKELIGKWITRETNKNHMIQIKCTILKNL